MTEFSDEVRRLLAERGMSLRELARRSHYHVSHVSNVLNGRKRLTAQMAADLDVTLGADGKLTGLAPAEPLHCESDEELAFFWPAGKDYEEMMRRRAFLLNAAILGGLGASDVRTAMKAIRHEMDFSLSGQRAVADVDEWNEIALEYGETYVVTAPGELLNALMVDLLGLQTALHRYTNEATQRELLRVSAFLAGFTAQTIGNLGHPDDARRWWRTARQAVARSGDPYSALWVRGREIVHAIDDRPIAAVLRLIEDAERFADDARFEVAIEVLAGKAQTLALAGRQREAEETLIQLRERFGSQPASSNGYSGSLLSWGEERLHNTESFAYSQLGDFDKAEAATTQGLALYESSSNVRWPFGLEMNRACSLVRSGDIAEGLNHARVVIKGLPEAYCTQNVIDRGRKLLGAVPQTEQRRSSVREYRDWLNTAPGALTGPA